MIEQLGKGHELHAAEAIGHEGREVVPALLAIGHDVDAGVLLVLDREQGRLLLELDQVGRLALGRRAQPARTRPAAERGGATPAAPSFSRSRRFEGGVLCDRDLYSASP